MLTARPISFISYNTRRFLEATLPTLPFHDASCVVFHKGLNGNKDHFHVWLRPNKSIDTSMIKSYFDEPCSDNEPLSIVIRPQCSSKFPDFYLYATHDSRYLAFKQLEREDVDLVLTFEIGDLTVEHDQLRIFYHKTVLSPFERLFDCVKRGLTLAQVYIELRTPFAQMGSVRSAYFTCLDMLNGREYCPLYLKKKSDNFM